jgi:hypothetical protein
MRIWFILLLAFVAQNRLYFEVTFSHPPPRFSERKGYSTYNNNNLIIYKALFTYNDQKVLYYNITNVQNGKHHLKV